jgi:hypothetical protein
MCSVALGVPFARQHAKTTECLKIYGLGSKLGTPRKYCSSWKHSTVEVQNAASA